MHLMHQTSVNEATGKLEYYKQTSFVLKMVSLQSSTMFSLISSK